ncbi:MAG: hypothetical protein JNG88_17065 [Phycisphaerales bacterium]|nr:hypothetical protein [Phycisphaerales bacterium]
MRQLTTLVLFCLLVGAGFAQTSGKPEDRAQLERVALGRAQSDVWRQLVALPVKPGLSLGAWAGRDARLDRELRLWIRSLPRTGHARFYSDQSCDVDIQIDPQALRDKLVELHKRFALPVTSDDDISRTGRDWPMIWGGGSSAASERVEAKPPGWEDISLEGVEVARRAAEADAFASLIDEIGRLRLTASRSLQEFIDSSEGVRAAIVAAIEKGAKVKVTHGADQVCQAEARMETVDVLRIMNDVFSTTYRGDDFQATDFREMAISAPRVAVVGIGLAVAPERHRLANPTPQIELDAPTWIEKKIEATGRFERTEPEPIALPGATERARLIAADQLRTLVSDLAIRKDLSVGTLLMYRPQLKDDVALFLSGARVVAVSRGETEDTTVVKVELSLRRLWEILKRGLTPVETDPSASQPADPPEGRG